MQSWAIKLNKKVRRLALASALSSKAHEGRLIVLEDMACTGKTKEMARWVKGTIVPAGERVSVLLVDADKWSEEGEMLRRASGNIPGVAVVPAAGINVWQVLKHDYLVMSRGAVERAIERLDLPNLRGWRIRPAGYVSPWRRLRMEAEKERKAAGVRLEHVRRRASAMDVAYRHRIELYPGQERPRGVAEDTD